MRCMQRAKRSAEQRLRKLRQAGAASGLATACSTVLGCGAAVAVLEAVKIVVRVRAAKAMVRMVFMVVFTWLFIWLKSLPRRRDTTWERAAALD